MASPFFLPVGSCQHRPSSWVLLSSQLGVSLAPWARKGQGYPTLLSVARSPPALVAPAILHTCLFLGCSLGTRERRERFQTVSGQGRLGFTEKAFALLPSEGSLYLRHSLILQMGPEAQGRITTSQGLSHGIRAYYTPQGHQGLGEPGELQPFS